MRAFLAKHQYLVVWILGLIIVGSLAVLIISLNGSYLPTSLTLPQPGGPAGGAGPTPLPAPSVTLSIQASSTKKTLVLDWQNLPGNTTALNIFRGKNESTSTWLLWQTVSVPAGQAGGGSAEFALGSADTGYSYYVQAVENGGSGGGGNGGPGSQNGTSTDVLWTSGATTPTPATPTPVPTATPPPTTASPTPANNQNPTPSPTNTPASGSTSTNNYTYYNPQVQGIGYGAASGNFWVAHANQSIEIGWQNLPANTDTIIVSRSQSEGGPWNQMLAEKNPPANGSSTLTIVDSTLNEPYYYEMTALHGGTTLATYGPAYLPAAGQ
jgi:hypothetical protein